MHYSKWRVTILFLLVGAFSNLCAQSFEGIIKYKSESVTDTAFVTYNVRESLIRIDESNTDGKITRSTIVDFKRQSVIAIDPAKKLYTDIYPKLLSQYSSTDFEIERTGNYKTINGYKCYQWRVRNRSAKTEVAYWVAEENFTFYDDLLKMLPLTNNSYTFFLSIPKTEGFLPMQVCERTLLRDVKNRFYVLDIKEQAVDNSVFEVPSDYQQFQTSR